MNKIFMENVELKDKQTMFDAKLKKATDANKLLQEELDQLKANANGDSQALQEKVKDLTE